MQFFIYFGGVKCQVRAADIKCAKIAKLFSYKTHIKSFLWQTSPSFNANFPTHTFSWLLVSRRHKEKCFHLFTYFLCYFLAFALYIFFSLLQHLVLCLKYALDIDFSVFTAVCTLRMSDILEHSSLYSYYRVYRIFYSITVFMCTSWPHLQLNSVFKYFYFSFIFLAAVNVELE